MKSNRSRLALGLVLASLAAGCGKPPPAEPPRLVVRCEPALPVTDAVTQARTLTSQSYLGLVRGETETDLGFRVSGIVDRIGDEGGDWREGQTFARDRLLAALQPGDFLSNSNQARAKFDFESARWTNNSKLYAEKAISAQEWDSIQSDYRSAQAEYDRATQSLIDSEIRAPFGGTLISRMVSSGETVMPGRPVLRIADLKTVAVDLGVPDRIVTGVKPGDEIKVWIRALEGTPAGPVRTGMVSEVGAAAREGSRLFKVVLKVANEDGSLKPGMTGSVEFREELNLPPDAVVVKLSALVAASRTPGEERTNGLAVFVVGPDKRARERRVTTDDIIRNSVIITGGLASGEQVVIAGAGLLYEGAPVELKASGGAP
ncbi:MAG: efflux RND transporter periplasmic adaptor subunit [Limisphaerales bacterium]